MGACSICGKPAGFLKSLHPECEQRRLEEKRRRDEGAMRIANSLVRAAHGKSTIQSVENELATQARELNLNAAQRDLIIRFAWRQAVDVYLEDGALDEVEENRLFQYCNHFRLDQDPDPQTNEYLLKLTKAGVIRDLREGKQPNRMDYVGSAMMNFQKNEYLIWAFPQTQYLETVKKRKSRGRGHGVNVRIAKGVYYRVGQFESEPVEKLVLADRGTGQMFLTSKHIYFTSPNQSFRIAYRRIVSFDPHPDGITVMREAATAKPQTFRNGDGWFTSNVIANLDFE